MAIRNVVTRGYGAGASIAFVVTRGYSIGAAAASVPVGDGMLQRGHRHADNWSRKKYDDFIEAWRAQQALEAKAAEAKGKRKVAVARAAKVAAEALEAAEFEAAEQEQIEAKRLEALTRLLHTAAQSGKANEQIARANAVYREAQAILREIAEDEEAIELLLLH
ncbi:MAG: hypothetical protein ACM3IH_14065 [Sphingobacteriales bacterium]